MHLLRLLADSLMLTGLTFGASLFERPFFDDKSEDKRAALPNRIVVVFIYGVSILYTILTVYFVYRGQENSDYFFWHPYIAWSFANAAYIIFNRARLTGRRIIMERLLMWQLIVIPVFAAMSLTVGWLMKLYIR